MIGIFLIQAIIIVHLAYKTPTESKDTADEDHQTDVSYVEKLFDPVAVFTLFLVMSTVLLWRSTERLAGLAEKQSKDTTEALAISNSSAEASQRSAVAASKTAEALLASEKPYVKELILDTDFRAAFGLGMFENSESMPNHVAVLHLTYRFKNYGRTPAEIIEYCLQIEMCKDQPFLSTKGGKGLFVSDFNLQEPTLAAQGETIELRQSFSEEMSWILSREITCKQKHIWFLGWVAWTDVFGNKSFRYFTWKYDHKRRFFTPREPVYATRSP